MDICMCILNNEPLQHWYDGNDSLQNLGLKLINCGPLDFEMLKPLRTYIKEQIKMNIPRIKFTDEIDLHLSR